MIVLKELIEARKVTPIIDRSYTLSEVPEAIRYLEEGHALTPAGIAEVERAVEEPNAPTEHFSLVVLQQFNAPVGAVVTGAGATVNVTQIVSGVVKLEEDDR
jgi:Zinc-binding dehydrogenase